MRHGIKQKVMALIACVAMVIPFLSPMNFSFASGERKSPLGVVATATDAKEEGGYYTLRLKNVDKYNVAGIKYEVFADKNCSKKLKSFAFSYNGYAYQTKNKKPVIIKSGSINEEKYYAQSDYLPYGTYYFKQSTTLYSDTDDEVSAETLGYKVDETVGSFTITKKNSTVQDILIVDVNNKTDALEDETSEDKVKGGEITDTETPTETTTATPTDASDDSEETVVSNFVSSLKIADLVVELLANGVYVNYNGSIRSGVTMVGSFSLSDGTRVYCGDHYKTTPISGTYSVSDFTGNENVRKVICYILENNVKNVVGATLAVNNAVHNDSHSAGMYILNAAKAAYPDTILTTDQCDLSLTVGDKTRNSISVKAEKEETIDGKERKVTPLIKLNGNSNNSISIDLPSGVWLKVANKWHTKGPVTLKGGQEFRFSVPKDSERTYRFLDIEGEVGCDVYKITTGSATQSLYYGETRKDSVSIKLTGAEVEHYYIYLTKNGAEKDGTGVKPPLTAAGITYKVRNSANEVVGQFVCSYNGYCYADAEGNVLIFKNKEALDNYKAKNGTVYTQFVEVEETGTYKVKEQIYLREISKGKLVRSSKLVETTGLIRNETEGTVTVTKDNTDKNTATNNAAAHFSGTDEEAKGSLMITKVDSKTFEPVEGAIYTVYSGTTPNNNNIVARFKTDINGVGIVQASPLAYSRKKTNVANDTLCEMPIGDYCMKETYSPIDYKIDTKLYPLKFTANNIGETVMQDFTDDNKNDPVNIAINKVDADGNSKEAGAASLANAQFEICLYSLTDNGRKYFTTADELKSAKLTEKWVVKTVYDKKYNAYRAILDNSHIVSGRKFEGEPKVPLGTITIREVAAPSGYMTVTGDNHGSISFAKKDENGNHIIDENGKIVSETITTDSFIGQLKETADGGASVYYNNEMSGNYLDIYEPVKRGDIKFRKVDEKDKAMAGIVFAITSNTTGETHYVVTDENGEFDSSKLTNTNNTNQNDTLENPSASNGVWFFGSNDKDNWDYTKVSDDRGAFVFDTYTISEIECDGNKGKQLATDVEVSVDANGEVFDAGKMVNVPLPIIKTKAYNTETGLQMADKLEVVDITDEVNYEYLEAGKEYTIKGIIMTDKGEAFLVDGKPVTAVKPFTASDAEIKYMSKGTEKLTFAVNTTLADRNLVVYEYLFEGNDEAPLTVDEKGSVVTDGVLKDREGNLICHADKDDKEQTINILGLRTKAWATSSNCNRVQATKDTEINDTLYYTGLTVGKTYKITSKIMYADSGSVKEVVSKTEDFTPTKESGEVTVTFDKFDTTPYAGKKFTIYETITLNDKLIVEETTIDNEEQTVYLVTLGTTLKDSVTDDHISLAGKEMELVDTVSYTNLNIGKEYTVEGVLKDKKTGKDLVDAAGNKIKASTTFVAKQENGTVDVVFTFDGSLLEGKTTVAFESLIHEGKEVASHNDLTDDDQTLKFPKGKTTAKAEESQSHVAFPDEKVTVIDTVAYENLIAGKKYSMTGTIYVNDGGKAKALVVDGKNVTATTTFTADTANGSVDMKFTFDASSLAGKSIVVFENCYYKGNLVFTHADIEDKDQTIYFPKLKTYATNKADGSKVLVKESVNTITDTIKYEKLDSSKTYTVKGVLMDKNTGKAVVNNGKTVETVKTFTPSGDDRFVSGSVSMDFTVDTTGYGGHTFVVYEYVYSSNGTLIAEHTDLTSEDQSVSIPTKVKTGDNSPIKMALIVMLAVLVLAGILIFARRRVVRR